MDERYMNWIASKVFDPLGKCKEVTEEMQKVFPELHLVRGHYFCYIWGEREHWWLVDPKGIIIDPTAEQFPSKGRGVYVPWDETAEEPTGMCLDCGGYTFKHKDFCSKNCEISYMAYINGGLL